MKSVTLGWDFKPTIVLEDGKILPRHAELIIHSEYYPNWPNEKWPIDPETKEKLPINEMYEKLNKSFKRLDESALKAGKEMSKLSELLNEQEEKQVADSYDITKSNFGYE